MTRNPHPRKELGQFFLRNREIARLMAEAIPTDSLVLEIGPGDGSLTSALLDSNHRVVGVELDPALVAKLQQRFQHRRDLALIQSNILKLDWSELATHGELNIAGNLPYHLTSPILFEVFERVRADIPPAIWQMVIMVQREVGRRLTAAAGSKEYGSLTLLTAWHGTADYLLSVPAEDFYPRPKVDGAVIRIRFHKAEESPPIDYESFRRLARGCFAQRRKMMRNGIRVVNDLPTGWENLNYDFTRRPEDFSFAEYVQLAQDLQRLAHSGTPSEIDK